METAEKTLKRFRGWSLAKCVEVTSRDLQKLARLEAADDNGYARCCSCGKREHYKKMDGGHFVSRSHKATQLRRDNVHAQCKGCNIKNGNQPGYSLFLNARYGEGKADELFAAAREVKQWTREELADLRYGFKLEIKEHERRIEG